MKETKIEKLILDLSNRWECTPQEAVDRLNSMNESEINKLINSMTKKFKVGGRMEWLPDLQYRETKLWTPDPKNPNVEWHTRTNRAVGKVYDSYPTIKGEQLGGDEYYSGGEQFINERPIDYISRWKDFHDRLQKEGLQTKMLGISKKENGGFIDCLRDGGSVEKCKCGCDKIAKAQDGKKVLPQFGKIIEQGWNAPRYTFLSDINGGDLSTVTPGNIGTYDGMSYAIEQVANPWGQYVNQMNKIAGLPEMSRMYRQPEFKTMIQQDDRGVPVSVEYSMDFLNPQFDQKKASKELSEKQTDIRAQKKACGGPLPKKSKFKK